MKTHPSPLWHGSQFEILPLKKDLFYSNNKVHNKEIHSVDAVATKMDKIHRCLNPADFFIFIPNPTPSQCNCATLQTPMGLILPCTSEGINS